AVDPDPADRHRLRRSGRRHRFPARVAAANDDDSRQRLAERGQSDGGDQKGESQFPHVQLLSRHCTIGHLLLQLNGEPMIKIADDIKELVNKALADGVPCLVGTVDPDGSPNIGPKGSVLVFDDSTLAYWERSFRGSSANVRKNDKVVIYYRNPAAA